MRLYYHKTDGGAEYLTDLFVLCPNGHKEGIIEWANYLVRLDGKPELTVRANALPDTEAKLAEAVELLERIPTNCYRQHGDCLLSGDPQPCTSCQKRAFLDKVKA